jgi:hypothetical protein
MQTSDTIFWQRLEDLKLKEPTLGVFASIGFLKFCLVGS